MAEIKTENIIYNIETKKNSLAEALDKSEKQVVAVEKKVISLGNATDEAFGKMGKSGFQYGSKVAEAGKVVDKAIESNEKKVESLDKTIKETAANSDKAFEKMGTSAKAYGEKLAAAEQKQKQLSRTINEQTRITAEFRSELVRVEEKLRNTGKNTVQFQRLTKEANNLKIAIKENVVALQTLKLDKKQVDESVNGLKKMAAESKNASGGLSTVKTELGGIAQSATQASGPLGNVTGILSRMGPIGSAVAIGISAIGAAFLNAKNTIQSFGDDVDVFMSRYEFRWRKFKERLAEGFVKTVSGEGAERIGRGKGFDELAAEAEERRLQKLRDKEDEEKFVQLKQDEFDLQDLKIDNIEKLGILERDRIRKISEFEQKRSNQGIVDKNLILDAEKLINDEFAIRIEIQKEENRISYERAKLFKELREVRKTEAENAVKLLELESQRDNLIKEIQERKRISNKEEKQQTVGILNVLREQIAAVQKAKNEALSIEEILQKEKLLFELNKTLTEMEEMIKAFSERLGTPTPDDLPLLDSILGNISSPESTPNQITAKIAALNKELGNTALGTARVKELKDEIERLQELLNNGGLPGTRPTLTQTKATDGKSDVELFLEEANEKVQIYGNMIRDLIAMDVERKDRQIDIQRERLNDFRRLAEFGNAEQLQLEEERLNKMIIAREQAAQRERQISALQIAAANAVSIAQGITAVTAGFAKGVVPGIAASVALAATIGATILAIRNSIGTIPAFAEGTEYVGLNGAPKGKDTIHARLDEGERVVSKKDNRELAGISNKKLVQVVKEYRLNNMRFKDIWTKEKPYDNSELLHGINRTNRLLEGLDLHANVNEYGLNFGIGRAQKAIKRKRNLSR